MQLLYAGKPVRGSLKPSRQKVPVGSDPYVFWMVCTIAVLLRV